jgi:hypothetical protein
MAPFLSYNSKYFVKPGIINIFPVKAYITQITAKTKRTKPAIGNITKLMNANGVNERTFNADKITNPAIVNKIPFLA